MHPEIASRWEKLEASRNTYLQKLSEIPADQLHHRRDDKWSAIQVTEHLLFSETGTLGYMKKKSSGGWEALENTGDEQRANGTALNTRLRSTEKYKAPSILPEPTNTTTHHDAIAQWNAVRADFHAFLSPLNETHFDKLVFKQPIAGMLNILQTLDFISNHIQHHIPQIEEIAASRS